MRTRGGVVAVIVLIAIMAFLGGWAGFLVSDPRGVGRTFVPSSPATAPQAEALPLPHHVPKYPEGVSLRFAMVHDVIHERFPWHGKAFYEERNRQVSKALEHERAKQAAGDKPSATYFGLLDDLGVGLERLGRHEDAAALMHDKLKEQQALGLRGRDLYSSYANLGTFLILWQLALGLADDPMARPRMTEGLAWVRESIEVNPQSHFGREIWQAVILEFLIAAIDRPRVLVEYDMIGDRFDTEVDPFQRRPVQDVNGMSYSAMGNARDVQGFLKDPSGFSDSFRNRVRQHITLVGAEEGWSRAVVSAHKAPVAFDEPALGIIGMWRLGGGANPHFALALAEIMMRVGQPYIAWCGYERAAQLSPYVWPDPKIQKDFADHCRRRQAVIERRLPAAEIAQLRSQFEAELAFGRRYQESYQAYEAQRIAAGAALDDPHFYDAFDAEHAAIASPIGPADQYLVEKHSSIKLPHAVRIAAMFFGAGLFAFVTALFFWLHARRAAAHQEPTGAGKTPTSERGTYVPRR
jgi:hypothetical protein